MRHQRLDEEEYLLKEPEFNQAEFQRWLPIFQRLGLKPRKYFQDHEAVYMGTVEGWFRLGLKKYDKRELKWLRSVLEYLDERSFANWAVPWQKTVIWEENTFCYLIQPWLLSEAHFQASDPASVIRIAEIMADLFGLGKDYCETRGIEPLRDRWQTMEFEWEIAIQKLDNYKNDFEHEKTRKEIDELRKFGITLLNESLTNWKKSGLYSLLEHHRQSGVLGHGNLLKKHIIWCGNDYYLLNWEHLAFQPRIADIASLINDVARWEPNWILCLLQEYSRIQPFWSEEYIALLALLQYPGKIVQLFDEMSTEDLNRKDLKEVAREMARKERCLTKAWKELGSQKRWAWRKETDNSFVNQGKISMVLSPVEFWGDFAGQVDSLIQVSSEQKLPSDVMERLSQQGSERIVAGRDGNILESAIKNENNDIEIVEPQPRFTEETEPPPEEIKVTENNDSSSEHKSVPANLKMNKVATEIVHWANFPKPVGENKKGGF